MLDWDRVRVFAAVAEHQNITHAGEALGLSQSAVSRQIQALESDMGVPLFHRRSRGLLLTEQGKILKITAEEMMAKLAIAENAISDLGNTPSGNLTVAVPAAIGTLFILPLIKEFRREYPDITLTILIADQAFDLSMRQADVAIRFDETERPDLIQRKLAEFANSVYASGHYLAEHGAPKTLSDLSAHTLVGYPKGIPKPFKEVNWLLKTAKKEGAKLTPSLTINSMVGILRAVKSDIGIACLPDYVVGNSRKLHKILPELDAPRTTAYFMYSEDMRHSKRIRAFRHFITRKIAELGL